MAGVSSKSVAKPNGRKAKPAEICFFYNNVESVWDHIVKINKCFKLDRKTQYFVTCGAADKNEQPIEAIANW